MRADRATCSRAAQFVLGDEVAAFEHEFAAYCGADARDRRQHRHERAAPGAARRRRRPGRRGHHRAVHLRRHRRGDRLHRRDARCSSTSTRTRSRWTRRRSRRRSRRGPRRSCRCTSTASRPTWTPILEIAERHGLWSSRTPARRTAPSTRAGAPAASATRLLQLLPRQEPRRLRRRRHGRHQRRRSTRKTIRMLRDWGQEKRYHHVLKGFNYRMDGIQGAILRVKLRHSSTGPRRGAAARAALRRAARRTPASSTPPEHAGTRGTSTTSTRSARRTATSCSSRCRPRASRPASTIPIPVHLQPAHADLGYQRRRLPALRGGGRRGAVAADVPGADADAGRAGRRGRAAGGQCRLSQRADAASSRPSTARGASTPDPDFEIGLADDSARAVRRATGSSSSTALRARRRVRSTR